METLSPYKRIQENIRKNRKTSMLNRQLVEVYLQYILDPCEEIKKAVYYSYNLINPNETPSIEKIKSYIEEYRSNPLVKRGSRLRAQREGLGIQAKEVYKKMNIISCTYYNMENGYYNNSDRQEELLTLAEQILKEIIEERF